MSEPLSPPPTDEDLQRSLEGCYRKALEGAAFLPGTRDYLMLCGIIARCHAAESVLEDADDLREAYKVKWQEAQSAIAALRTEVREWLCIQCNTVYPGPPQDGFACVQCPRCLGDCGPREAMEHRQTKHALAALQAKLNDAPKAWVGREYGGNIREIVVVKDHAPRMDRSYECVALVPTEEEPR